MKTLKNLLDLGFDTLAIFIFVISPFLVLASCFGYRLVNVNELQQSRPCIPNYTHLAK